MMWNPFRRTQLTISVDDSWQFHCEGNTEHVEAFYAHWLQTLADNAGKPPEAVALRTGFQPNDLGTVESTTEIAHVGDETLDG